MIRIENISKRFKKLQALDNISAQFQKGQVVSLIGPNGSGKTTLIKCILGMVKPAEGKIFVDEMQINGDPSYRDKIGYMPQIGRYPDNMKIGQLFTMMKHIRNTSEEKLDTDLITKFNLISIFDKPMRTLSGGTRQKVSAALAFYFNPAILILDEPTAGLDPLSSEILKEKIIAEKKKKKVMLKLSRYVLYDILRSKVIIAYTLFLFIVSMSLFRMDENSSKAMLSLLNIVLIVVPLISMIFTTIHYYNSYEFIELMLSQPMSRTKILLSEYSGVALSLVSAFFIGVGIPVLVFTPNAAGLAMIFTGFMLTLVFTSIAFWASVKAKDKARGIGFALLLWFYFSLIYDGLVLVIL